MNNEAHMQTKNKTKQFFGVPHYLCIITVTNSDVPPPLPGGSERPAARALQDVLIAYGHQLAAAGPVLIRQVDHLVVFNVENRFFFDTCLDTKRVHDLQGRIQDSL